MRKFTPANAAIILLALAFIGQAAMAQNVGIGTSTPGYKLDVMGRMRIQAGTVNSVFTSPGIWLTDYRTNTNIAFIGMADSVNYGFWGDRPDVGWQFFFDARYGNVGIGRKPASGTQRLSLDHPGGASLNVYANGNYRGGFQATDSTLEIFGAYSAGTCIPGPCPPPKDIVFWPASNCTGIGCVGSPIAGRIGMYTNTPNARVHIVAGTNTSGVLIGGTTSIPATGYMLNVDGKVICEELMVRLSTSWPDYVFNEKYNLPSIDEYEKNVRANKHLPNIPSAEQINNDNGISLGEMQRRMMEKIEELSLFIFELNKKNKALENEMARLKSERQ
jgi:hypothetical protein